MKKIELVYGLDDLAQVAQQLKELIIDCDVITFTGLLGVGKTTLIRELLSILGVQEQVTSPTFAYMNIYKNPEGSTFVHFDLYRLDNLDQFIAAGFDEYLNADAQVLIEWPEIIMPLLANRRCCHITLDYAGTDKRRLTLENIANR